MGVSGYTCHPTTAGPPRETESCGLDLRQHSQDFALGPDLVLGFSDLQAGIVADLMRAGVDIFVFNQRDVDGIFEMILTLGAIVGPASAPSNSQAILSGALRISRRRPAPSPNQKSISRNGRSADLRHRLGIRTDRDRRRRGRLAETAVSAGRQAPDHCARCGARSRARRDPRLMVRQEGRAGSHPATSGLERYPAVCNDRIVEIKSTIILQPGPGALTDGLDAIVKVLWPPRPTLRRLFGRLARVLDVLEVSNSTLKAHRSPSRPCGYRCSARYRGFRGRSRSARVDLPRPFPSSPRPADRCPACPRFSSSA